MIQDWDGFLFAAEKVFMAVADLRCITLEIGPILEASEKRYRQLGEKQRDKCGGPGTGVGTNIDCQRPYRAEVPGK